MFQRFLVCRSFAEIVPDLRYLGDARPRRRFLHYNRRFDEGQLTRRVRMVGPKQQLYGQSLAKESGGHIGSGDATVDIGIFISVVKPGQYHGMGQFLFVVVQILLYKMGNIVADTYEGGRPAAQTVQIGIDFFLIGKTPMLSIKQYSGRMGSLYLSMLSR